MISISATKAKNKFGEMLDDSKSETIEITKQGRATAYLINPKLFKLLQTIIDDSLWAEAALEAKKEGLLGIEESQEFLDSL